MLNATTALVPPSADMLANLAQPPAPQFLPAFAQSALMTLACEFGDRTFFIAALLAMRASRIAVWCGTMCAVVLTTAFSAAVSRAVPALVEHRLTNVLASALFCAFGLAQLHSGWSLRSAGACGNAELAEVETDLREQDRDGRPKTRRRLSGPAHWVGPAFCTAFSMTVAAECGDRSQFATIALAASKHLGGVMLGGVVGHAVCTAIAVIGGRMLSSRISQSDVSLMAGATFFTLSLVGAWSSA